jgi:hypothetical protein
VREEDRKRRAQTATSLPKAEYIVSDTARILMNSEWFLNSSHDLNVATMLTLIYSDVTLYYSTTVPFRPIVHGV